jgi:hypothetical protein
MARLIVSAARGIRPRIIRAFELSNAPLLPKILGWVSQKCLAKVGHFARIFATSAWNMKIGYARVSTLHQNLDLQLQP